MKTEEELAALREEIEMLNKKLHELTGEELESVCGGAGGYPEWGRIGPEGYDCSGLIS